MQKLRFASSAKVLPSLLCCLFAAMWSMAADPVDLRQSSNLVNSANQNRTLSIAGSIGLSNGDSFEMLRHFTHQKTGLTHSRVRQLHNGIPVWGHNIVITENDRGTIVQMNGTAIYNIGQDLNMLVPAIDAETALDFGKSLVNTSFTARNWNFENESSELVIYVDDSNTAKLAYAVSYFADTLRGGQPTRPTYIIDAISQEILFQYEGLTTADGTGPGGNTKTGQYEYGTDFGFLDVAQSGSTYTMNNANVKTVDLNHGTSGSSAYSYSGPRNTKKTINGAYSPLNDAHYFGGVVFNMYSEWYNTAPLTFQLTMRVHYSSNYQNAFWNGSSMTFGDGGSTFYPLVSLDVSSHEVSHGFTEQNSNLTYANQSGGINEAFSDMAGEAAEAYMRGTNDWLVGADIFKASGALRYMQNPPQDGVSIGHASDYYSGMDVHYSSGVFNKAFYLLSVSQDWTTRKAFEVFVVANQTKWTASTNYQQGAQGAFDAAVDLGYNTDAIVTAFDQVGITLDGGGDPPPPPTVTELQNGVPVSNLGASTGNYLHYKIAVPAGATNLNVQMSGGSGDADLYTRFGAQPTDSTYDCRPYASGNNESCPVASPSAGDYYVSIKAYSTFSGVSLVASYETTTPNQAPTAAFSSSTDGLTASFSNSSSDPDGDSLTYSWNFGDGNTSTEASPSHTYASAGTYSVSLSVSDGSLSDSASASVTVEDTTPPPPGEGELTNGVPVSGLAASQGEWLHFFIDVPAGASNLSMSISGGSGDADIYTRFGSQPDQNNYDCRPYQSGNNENCAVASPSAGTYYVSIRAYSTFSGVSVVASYEDGTTPPPGGGEINETNLSGASGAWDHYTIVVPEGATSLNIESAGGTGDADLYVRFDAEPTQNDWDYRPYRWGNNETVTVSNPQAGTWHVSLRGYSAYSGVTLTGSSN